MMMNIMHQRSSVMNENGSNGVFVEQIFIEKVISDRYSLALSVCPHVRLSACPFALFPSHLVS